MAGYPRVWPRSLVAAAVGFCVERGADPVPCAEPVLTGLREEIGAALECAARWPREKGELPEPDRAHIDRVIAVLGGDLLAVRLGVGWCGLQEWFAPALAVLRSAEVRRRHGAELLSAISELEAMDRHGLRPLRYAAAILDEPLTVLHRPTGTGYEVRIGGIGDNFQLHTLLAHVLIGGGHLPGTAPAAEAVRPAVDPAPATGPSGVTAYGSFDLRAPDGGTIRNEGLPADVPVVDGRRLLVLDHPSYRRSWNADRYFPDLPGSAELLRVLPAEEARAWFARTALDG
ncbi:hypothetical protein HUT16_36095 [Kitasatospora sp. NA04385]|uniref:hypothetical protein n=1 Tax=Kitasatospora sp. NA04385 TaxID=2742135 RepID=UPI0015911817|nr:hypothetical protein [Kitasatospora sp. NA04385]QKW23807.1 hypothetical protein HUT16_36095 [Kitasatospora sp. NA04385]